MMKNCFLAIMLAALVYCMTPSAIAQDNGANDQQSAPAGEGHGHGHRNFDPAKRTEMLTKRLDLTSDQQPKVLDIFKSEQSQMESVHSDSSLSDDARHSKMMEIHKSTNDQIRALLDSNQQKKFDEMQSHRGRWQGNQGNGQSGGTPPSSDQK